MDARVADDRRAGAPRELLPRRSDERRRAGVHGLGRGVLATAAPADIAVTELLSLRRPLSPARNSGAAIGAGTTTSGAALPRLGSAPRRGCPRPGLREGDRLHLVQLGEPLE